MVLGYAPYTVTLHSFFIVHGAYGKAAVYMGLYFICTTINIG